MHFRMKIRISKRNTKEYTQIKRISSISREICPNQVKVAQNRVKWGQIELYWAIIG